MKRDLKSKTLLTAGLIGWIFFAVNAFAGSITKPNTFVDGTTAAASEVNANFDTLYDEVNRVGAVLEVYSSSVGIGTTTPTATLDVNGSVKLGSGGSAFVKIQYEDFVWNPPSVGTSSSVYTELILAANCSALSVKLPASDSANLQFIWEPSYRTFTDQKYKVSLNNVGPTYDHGAVTIRIWEICE